MKLHWILFSAIFLFVSCIPVQGLIRGGSSLQDYVDGFVDVAKFKLKGVSSLNDSTVSGIWSYYKSKYGRVYSSVDEEEQRFGVFFNHLKYVVESNLQGSRTYQLELNEFADWTTNEFDLLKKGLITSNSLRRRVFPDDSEDKDLVRRSLNRVHQNHDSSQRIKRSMINKRHHQKSDDKRGSTDWLSNLITRSSSNSNNNDNNNAAQSTGSFDWRQRNVVGSVKDQQQCGSCYAFATTAVLESLYAIKTNSTTVIDFSPQQIVDCSSNGNYGCNGGNFAPSLRYLSGHGSKLATLASYPYTAEEQTCKTTGIKEINLGKIKYGQIPEGDEETMAQALVYYGPLFIGLNVDSQLFMFYKSGVLNIIDCPSRPEEMDHAMVAVGYGYDTALELPYWIIKNSWGKGWGDNGYFRLAKDQGNMCGIASMAYCAKLT